MEVWCTNGSSF